MEDTQPNEVRLSRKGSTNIPRVCITRPVHASYPKTPTWHHPERVEVHRRLPPECQKGAPGSHNARKRWINDQKHPLWTDRHLSVLSFRYLENDNRVLFTCRTQQAAQSTRHHARGSLGSGSHLVGAHPDTERNAIPRQAKHDYSNLSQNTDPGPSQPLILSSGYSVQTQPVEPSTTGIESHAVQILYADPVPRHRAPVYTTPQTESVVDLTLDLPGSVAEERFARWSTFQSGYVGISLPAFSGSSPEASTDPRPGVNQTLAQVVGQLEDTDTPVVQSSDTNPHTTHPDARVNDIVPVRLMEDHRVGGPLSNQLRQPNALEAACSDARDDCSVVLRDQVEMLPSSVDYSPSVPGFAIACGNLPLSLGSHDKPRRILHGRGFTYVITAHGIVDQVNATSVLKLDRHIRSPSLPFEEFVDDACTLSHQGDPVIILGHAREQDQIAFLSLGHGQMSPLRFVSGGYDHRVHLWDIAQDFSGASAVELAIKHTSLVHSLLPIVDTSHKLVSVGADCDIPIYDLSAERVVQTLKTSCTPYHAHKTDSRSCIILEVSHFETQFEIRDHRMPTQAVQRFGFLTEDKRGRFEKADSWSHFVICGDRNGAVHLWDLRNVSREVALQQCFNDPVIQVINTGPRLLACSKRNELACIKLQCE